MQRVKTATAVADKPAYSESGTPGYFTKGDAVAAKSATAPGQDWFNQVQEELIHIITAAGLTPSATDDAQLKQAIAALIAAATPAATEKAAGVVELAPDGGATAGQAVQGSDSRLTQATTDKLGTIRLAALAVALAGKDTTTAMTPADVAAAIANSEEASATAVIRMTNHLLNGGY